MSASINYRELSIEERLRLVQDIWDSIAEEGPPDLIPPWQQAILDQRLKEYEQNPDDVQTWEEVRREIEAELGR